MGIRANKVLKRMAAAIVGLLGFASCVDEEIIDDQHYMVAYGTLHAAFKASGSVNDQNGKPIEGIRVAVTMHHYQPNTPTVRYDHNHTYIHDTLFTDSKGEFLMQKSIGIPVDDATFVFEDVDGEEHGGSFNKAETTPPVTQTAKSDSKTWFLGAFETESKVVMKK